MIEWTKPLNHIQKDDLVSFQKELAGGPPEGQLTLLGWALFDAVENRAKRCFQWLVDQPDAVRLGGSEALGAAARDGKEYYVRALLEAGADGAGPEWELDSEWDTLITGAAESMKPEIFELARTSGTIARTDPRWLKEALEFGLKSRKKHRVECLTIFAKALLDRFEEEGEGFVPPGLLNRLVKVLQKGKVATAETKELAGRLSELVDPTEALREEIIDCIAEGRRFNKMWELLGQLPADRFHEIGTEMLAWVARKSNCADDDDPDLGWMDVVKLLDLGVGLDGKDSYGRTALMYLVHGTSGREELIRRMVKLGADVNAIDFEEKKMSVYDFSQYGYAEKKYGELLRSLGARSGEELAREREEQS